MANIQLIASSPLSGYAQGFPGVTLMEVSGRAIVSIATPNGGEKKLADAVKKAWKISTPKPGTSTTAKADNLRILGLQRDQVFAVFDHDGDDAAGAVAKALGKAGYYTDQSDSWAILRIDGPASRAALERICPIDLHPDAFPNGAVARTVMEYLGVIVFRDGEDSFVLLSARSSARSFLHMVETSIHNVI